MSKQKRNKNRSLKVMFEGSIEQLSMKEVLKHISADALRLIKAVDPKPILALFDIGSEGLSTGSVKALDSGNEPWYRQLWTKDGIKSLVNKARSEVSNIFIGHNPENSSRMIAGQIINAKMEVDDDGKAHAIALGHITNQDVISSLNDGELDTCSIEATCVFREDEDRQLWVVDHVKNFGGLALADSEVESPGFESATVLGVLAALDGSKNITGKKTLRKVEQMEQVTLSQVKAAIIDNGWDPVKVFNASDILACACVKGAIDSEVKEVGEEKDLKIKEMEKEYKPLIRLKQREQIKEHIIKSDLLKDAPKKQIEYLQSQIKVDISDMDDAEIKETIMSEIKDSLANMKGAGITFKVDEDGRKKDEEDSEKGSKENYKENYKENNEEKNEQSNSFDNGSKDYTDPKNNPLIPT